MIRKKSTLMIMIIFRNDDLYLRPLAKFVIFCRTVDIWKNTVNKMKERLINPYND